MKGTVLGEDRTDKIVSKSGENTAVPLPRPDTSFTTV